MERDREMDVREENLRSAEVPFAQKKKELEKRDEFLSEREEDIYTREANFLQRMENGDQELAEMKKQAEADLKEAARVREESERE